MATTICEICSQNPAKYRCPSCRLQSCSLKCTKTHTENCPGILTTSQPNNRPLAEVSNEASDNRIDNNGHNNLQSPFSALEHSDQLQRLFAKYPNLRADLHTIFQYTVEQSDDIHAPENRLDDRGRNRRYGNEKRWKPEQRLNHALYQLRKLQGREGVDGEGIREFFELVKLSCTTDEPSSLET
ncbi:MAG: hypothetical protein M1834_003168 [Cirrosporium novae-zelandiae]|nr:MAG: hypothetical protein M1834_003168 [Cirrosporium novae-zelandiae]